MTPPPAALRAGADDATAGPSAVRLALPARAWTGLIAGFTIVVLLLALTTVTLISQRQRTVLLNRQLGTLVGQATGALRSLAPVLGAVPRRSTTITSRASAAAQLVAQARRFLEALSADGLSSTVAGVDTLVSTANREGVIPRLIPLLDEAPSAARSLSQLSALASAVTSERLVTRAVSGLRDLDTLVALQKRLLATERSARGIETDTLGTGRATLKATLRLLAIGEQSLVHVENLDRKVP